MRTWTDQAVIDFLIDFLTRTLPPIPVGVLEPVLRENRNGSLAVPNMPYLGNGIIRRGQQMAYRNPSSF